MLLNCGAGEDLRVPWTAGKSNQSILKEINPEYSVEGLKVKLQYFDHLMQRADSLEKTLMLGKIEGRRRRGQRRMRWLDGFTESMGMGLSKVWVGERQGSQTCCNPWGHRVRHKLATEQQQHRKTGCCLACMFQEHLLWKATLWGYSGSLWRDPQQAAGSSGGHLARNWDLQAATRLGLEATLPAPVKLEILAVPGHSLTVDSYERPQARLAKSLLGSWSSESVWENVCCFKVLSLEVICHIRLEN